MNKSIELVISIFHYLNKSANYAVLRNYEALPYGNNSRDIDIIITKKEYKQIEIDLVDIIVKKGFFITSYYTSSRMNTFLCSCYDGGNVDIIQFDFFFNTSLYSLILLKAEDILKNKEFNGKVYHVSKEYEFLDKYLYFKGLNLSYPEKYESVYECVQKRGKIDSILQSIYEINSLKDLESMTSLEMKLKILVANIKRHMIYQGGNLVIDIYYTFANYIYYKGFSIGFTGPDGSGKTTVIDLICSNLSKAHNNIELFHFRPTVLSNIGEVAHNAGLTKTVDKEFNKPHRGAKTGFFNSILRLCYYTSDYIIGYYRKIRKSLYRRSTIIFDRYYTDIIADSRRSRIYLDTHFLYYWGKLFIPSLNYNILLTADADTILARKQELDREGIDRINSKLDYLKDKKGYYLVLNNGKPEEAVRKILTLIFDEQHRRNLKRLNVCTTPKND